MRTASCSEPSVSPHLLAVTPVTRHFTTPQARLSSALMAVELVLSTRRPCASSVMYVAKDNALPFTPWIDSGSEFHVTRLNFFGHPPVPSASSVWQRPLRGSRFSIVQYVLPYQSPPRVGWRRPDCHARDAMYSKLSRRIRR